MGRIHPSSSFPSPSPSPYPSFSGLILIHLSFLLLIVRSPYFIQELLISCIEGSKWYITPTLARRICTSYVDPKSISPLLACRLIALDKKPGVRPIGIGDTARRIIAKAVLSVAKPDIQEASGCLQMCGGQISGIEAAVHAVRTIFNSSDTEAVLLVDATNSLNRQVALQNIRRPYPPLATILINTYRAPTELFADGDTLLSQEGTTQGDPLAMPMYALATIPLIKKLSATLSRSGMQTTLLP